MLDRLTIERMLTKAGERPILIALSGGGDSVALLHLLAEAIGAARLRAAVIDHALRTGSDADGWRAAEIARGSGVEAELITLSWRPDASRAHEAAREARYGALCAAARRLGARVVATGHTRDDQAETVLLRGARGSGLRGLAAMRALAPMPFWPEGRGLWLARPLLGARRFALRDQLQARGAAWIDDPANVNEAYARVRARQALAELAEAGLDPMRFAVLAERLAPHVRGIDEAALALIEESVVFEAAEARITREAWGADTEVRQRALSVLITAAGAHARGPAPEQVDDLDRAMHAPSFEAATLAGAVVKSCGAHFVLTRDRGALAGRADGAPGIAPLALQPGIEALWDSRVALTVSELGWSVVYENGAALLARGEERAALAAASPHWLIKERVQHLLGTD